MEAFTIQGKIELDTSGVASALDSVASTASTKLQSLGSSFSSIGSSLTGLGSKLTLGLTAPLAALGTGAVKTSLTFEDAMAKVSTIADTSEMSIEDLEKAILNLSDSTGVSSAEIADNVYNAISAGQKTGDAVNFVSEATKLATAGFAESGQALDILSTIMNAYGLEAKDVTKVSDILIQTQNKGKTTVAELASSMGKVIPTANAYNVGLEQISAGYALMTAGGIATAESTTYMNSMLNELGKSGTTVSGILKEKTGKSFAELMDSGMSLGDVLEILQQYADATGVSMGDLWSSSEAGKAALVLLKDGADGFNTTLGYMQESTGMTDEAFQKMHTTSYELQLAVNELKNVLIELGGSILEVLAPVLKELIEKVKEFKTWFDSLDEGTKEMIVKIGLVVIAIGPLLTAIGSVFTAIGSILTVGGTLLGGLGSIAGFIGSTLIPAIVAIGPEILIIIAVIGALIAIGVLLYKNWDEICQWASKLKEKIAEAWDNVKKSVSEAVDRVKEKVQEMKDKVTAHIQELKDKMSQAWDNIKQKVEETWDNIKEKTVNAVTEIRDKTVEKFTELKEKAIENFNAMKEKVVEAVTEVRDKAVEKFTELKEKAVEKVDELKEKATEAFSKLKEEVTSKVTELKEKAQQAFTELKEKATEAVENLKSSMVEKFNAIKETCTQAITALKEKSVQGFTEMASKAEDKFNALKEKVNGIFSSIKDHVHNMIETVKGMFNFEWKFPEIKLPHFSIEWDTQGLAGEVLEKLGLRGLPKVNVEWYKDGGILTDPTAFGFNSATNSVMMGGEAGAEAILPIDNLREYIRDEMNNSELVSAMRGEVNILNKYLPLLLQALNNMNFKVDEREFARLVKGVN